MLVLSPRQRFSVASNRWIGATGPLGRGTPFSRTSKSRCAWPRRQQAPGCAWALAGGSANAAPRGDTRLRTPRRLPPEPLLRLGQVASTPSRWRILPGESAANWEAARGTGNPSQGWGQPRALFCQELFRKSRGAARAATLRPRAEQRRRVRRRPLHGAPGQGWRQRLPQLPPFLLPGGGSPSSTRAAGGPRGHCHRHLFARLSPGALAALGAGPPPRGRVGGDARASQPGSSFCSSSSPAKPGHRLPGVPAPVSSGQNAGLQDWAGLARPEEGAWLLVASFVPGATGSMPSVLRRHALPADFGPLQASPPDYSRQQLPPWDARILAAARKTVLATSGDLSTLGEEK